MSGSRGIRAVLAAGALCAAIALAGCGSGERRFDAASIAAELNETGAGIELGEQLPASSDGAEIHEVELAHAKARGHAHGAGALLVLDDSETAEDEFARCESALDFTCFRAANVVLRFTGMSPVDQQLMSDSVSALGTGG